MFRTKKDVDKHVRSTLLKLRDDEVSTIFAISFVTKKRSKNFKSKNEVDGKIFKHTIANTSIIA